jgi:hypothetical protein
MYYLLSFKLLRRKNGGHNVSQNTTRLDAEFIGFSDFLKNLSDDKKIAVRRYFRKNSSSDFSMFIGTKYICVST